MDKYTIHYTFEGKKDMNEILIKVLNKELKKYILMICKSEKCEVPSLRSYLSEEREKIVREFKQDI